MKYLMQKLVKRNNEQLLLQLETLIQVCSVIGVLIGITSLILVYQEKTKIIALILMILMWLIILFVFCLRKNSKEILFFCNKRKNRFRLLFGIIQN